MIKSHLIYISIISFLLLIGCESNEDIINQNSSTPYIITSTVSNISTQTGVSGGNVTTNGDDEIIEKGVVYSTVPNPTYSDFKISSGSGLGQFTSNMTSLNSNTRYYVRAFARNDNGIYYGNETSFSTLEIGTPSVVTQGIINITDKTATGRGIIFSNGGSTITERGIVWNTTENPTVNDFKATSGNGIGQYTESMTNLTANTNYTIRAYAINSNGVFYGNDISFTTLDAVDSPSMNTLGISNITNVSASSGGIITTNGGAPITDRGIVWSLSINPTIADFTITNGNGLGQYTSNMTNLTSNTTYFVRAYAINSNGVFYGTELTFTTLGGGTTYAIGDVGPGGGFVFEVDASGLSGKEIAPASTEFESQWGCPITSVAGTSAAVGSGQANSTLILDYHDAINYYNWSSPLKIGQNILVITNIQKY